MGRRVVFRKQAGDEALEVCEWYEWRRPGLGQEFGQALDVLVTRIADSPLAFPRVHNETGRAASSCRSPRMRLGAARFSHAATIRLRQGGNGGIVGVSQAPAV